MNRCATQRQAAPSRPRTGPNMPLHLLHCTAGDHWCRQRGELQACPLQRPFAVALASLPVPPALAPLGSNRLKEAKVTSGMALCRSPPSFPSCRVRAIEQRRGDARAAAAGFASLLVLEACQQPGPCHLQLPRFAARRPLLTVDKFGRRFLFIEGGIQMAAAQVRVAASCSCSCGAAQNPANTRR